MLRKLSSSLVLWRLLLSAQLQALLFCRQSSRKQLQSHSFQLITLVHPGYDLTAPSCSIDRNEFKHGHAVAPSIGTLCKWDEAWINGTERAVVRIEFGPRSQSGFSSGPCWLSPSKPLYSTVHDCSWHLCKWAPGFAVPYSHKADTDS